MSRVLVADDNKEMLETLEQIFLFHGLEVEKVMNGKEALNSALKIQPDLILLDGMMPVMDGFEACRRLKANHNTKDIPVVFLSANYTEAKHRVIALELGADDYLIKPFNSKELVTRCKAIIKRTEMLSHLKSQNEHLALKNKKILNELDRLQQQAQAIDKKAVIDNSTGLYNFLFFTRRLDEEFARSQRYGNPLSLVAVQINDFDKITSIFGHQLGNYILMKIANDLLRRTRASDIMSHSDEDIFYIMLPQTDQQGAFYEQERLKVALLNINFLDDEIVKVKNISNKLRNELQNLNINLGMATYGQDVNGIGSAHDLLEACTRALKLAVQSGKNQSQSYRSMVEKTKTEND